MASPSAEREPIHRSVSLQEVEFSQIQKFWNLVRSVAHDSQAR